LKAAFSAPAEQLAAPQGLNVTPAKGLERWSSCGCKPFWFLCLGSVFLGGQRVVAAVGEAVFSKKSEKSA
jgi:hypothetical protein